MGTCSQLELQTTGDEMIDREHADLAKLSDKVRHVSQSPNRDLEVMNILSEMYLYAKAHFFDEEWLMERVGFPEREAHAAMHKIFLIKTHELTDARLAGSLDFSALADFLADWLAQHVVQHDAKIMRFAKAQE